MRPPLDETMMQVAETFAERSTCLRRAVGCVLTDRRGHVLSTGYNGVSVGQPHCNEPRHAGRDVTGLVNIIVYPHECAGARAKSGTNLEACQAIHAEQNALLQCRDVYAIETCYCTTSPCVTCTKLLLNTSCKRILYRNEYPHAEVSRSLFATEGRIYRPLPVLRRPT